MIGLAWQVHDIEVPWECALFETEQPRVGYLVKGAISKYLYQGFVVCDDQEFVTSLREVASLLKAPRHSKGLAFDRCVTLFRWGKEPRPS